MITKKFIFFNYFKIIKKLKKYPNWLKFLKNKFLKKRNEKKAFSSFRMSVFLSNQVLGSIEFHGQMLENIEKVFH